MKLFGEDGFKGFLALHVEKILFLLACVLAVLLIFGGFGNREALDSNKSPADLNDQVSRTKQHIDQFQWTTHYEKDRDLDQEFLNRAQETLEPIQIDSYSMNQTLRPPVSPPPGRRQDPELLAALQLQVRPGYGALSKSTSFRGGFRRGAADAAGMFDEQIDDDKKKLDEDKVRPIQGGMGGRGAMAGRRQFNRGDQPKGVYFVAVTALVPMRDQFIKYQDALRNARGFDPARDVPTVLDWELERATAVAGQEPQWQKIATLAGLEKKDELGAPRGVRGRESDEADDFDPRFADPYLTMDVPNISTRNMGELVIHDRIHELTSELEAKAEEEPEEEARERDSNRRTSTRRPTQGRNPRMDQRMGAMDEEGGEDGYRGSSGRGGFREGASQGPLSQFGRREGSDLTGDMDPDEVPEFKMFRYVDLDVEPGTAYQYRLSLTFDDPNQPVLTRAPELDSLEPAVQIRVTSVERDQEGRPTEMSTPSEVVRVREGSVMLVGSVQPPNQTPLKGTTRYVRVPYAEPVAQVMALEFDQQRATDIPKKLDVRRGSVGNFNAKGIWVPVFWEGLSYEETHDFKMDNLVLDITGGDQANPEIFREERRDGPRRRDYAEFLSAPGQLLVLEPSGRIRVRHELEDTEAFQEIDDVLTGIEKEIKLERESQNEQSDERPGANEGGRQRGPGGIFGGQEG